MPQITSSRTPLTAVLVGGTLAALGIGLFSFVVPLAGLDDRISGAWLGSVFACYYLAKLLVSPLSGLAADRFGARPVLLVALCAGCCLPLGYFFHPGLNSLYAVQILLGITSGLVRPVSMATLAPLAHSNGVTRTFALQAALFNAAAFVGPLVGGALYASGSVMPVLLGLIACMGIAAASIFFLLPNGKSSEAKGPNGAIPPEHTAVTTTSLLLAIGGRTLGIGLLTAFYPILLAMTLGQQGMTVALLYALPGATTFIGLLLTARKTDDNQISKPIRTERVVLGLLLSAAGLFLLGYAESIWQFALFGLVIGAGAALSLPTSLALASSLTPRQGAIFGAANATSGVGFLIGPMLGGFMVQQYHSIPAALHLAACLGGLASLPLLTVVLRDRLHQTTTVSNLAAAACALLMLLFAGAALMPLTQHNRHEDLYRFSDVAMGTVVNLTLEAHSRKAAQDAAAHALTAMRALQKDFDHRNPSGSIGRVNLAAGKGWVTPTPRALDLLKRALQFSEQSHGVFDPTVGALTTNPLYYALDPSVARKKSPLVNYRKVLFDDPGIRVRLLQKGMALDLGGIAKGTIVDAAVALLKKEGITAGIVEAGGDFYCFGARDWTVGIRHPRDPDQLQTITVREKGVCGSGDYQQFVTEEKHGTTTRHHHIIDPDTMDAAHRSTGVTVIADSAEAADALATTLFIMGPYAGAQFIKEHAPGSAAVWFLPDNTSARTDNFPN